MSKSHDPKALEALVAAELLKAQPDAVVKAAEHAAARHKGAVLGVLFYGSCLRTGELDDKILDFYLIVPSYKAAYESRGLALANQLLPPNVFYDEFEHDGRTLRTKYNVISLDDMHRRVQHDCRNVSLWARFSQPMALLIAQDETAIKTVVAAVSQAVQTMIDAALPLCAPKESAAQIWTRAFGLTYGAELRSEPPGKGAEIYQMDQARYDRFFGPAIEALGVAHLFDNEGDGLPGLKALPCRKDRHRAQRQWRVRRLNGKVISFLRLIKASTTFDGGIDYLAWKIQRHSGVEIEISPWQRRHPVIAGLLHFYRLRRRGAFR